MSNEPIVSQFRGFGDETFRFLAELTEHNEKAWFDANRSRYEAHYLQPALAFIETLGPRLAAELPDDVRFEARINGSLFRINRDIRFSKDKTPYKTISTCGSGRASAMAGSHQVTSCVCCRITLASAPACTGSASKPWTPSAGPSSTTQRASG